MHTESLSTFVFMYILTVAEEPTKVNTEILEVSNVYKYSYEKIVDLFLSLIHRPNHLLHDS